MEQPLGDASAIAFTLGCESTAKHTKLCYSGEGADEFFGGYNMYRNAERYGENLKTFYVGNTNIMKEDEKKKILKRYYDGVLPINLVKDIYEETEGLDPLAKMSDVDIQIWLEGDIYLNVDKMSTASGLEIRMAAGLASCGKKPFAASPASFLSTRSYEQCKVDCAYSDTNVKLIGISGGISYGALGMSHHSAQDFAAMSAIPNMRVYVPSDQHQTRKLFEALLKDDKCAYIRVGRNPVEDVYSEENCPFIMDKAMVPFGSVDEEADVAIIACGELVKPAVDAAAALKEHGNG